MLFVEKFKPKKLEDFILPPRIIKQFQNGLYGHALFYGNPGIGKSALAKFLAGAYPCKYFNASEEGRVDVLRNEITDYCTNVQLNDEGKRADFKVVILDEIDGVSDKFFEALRGFMDSYAKNVRIVATCNYINKVTPPIQSRFELINFGFESTAEEDAVRAGYTNRMKAIIVKAMKSQIDDDALTQLVRKNFPDFRGILQDLQRFYHSGLKHITLADAMRKNYEFTELYDLILSGRINEPEKIHELLMGDYATKVQDVLGALDNNFIEYIVDKKADYKYLIPHVITRVCYYQSLLHQVIDPALAMKACVFELMQVVAAKTVA